jgi:hypothetical protein
VDWNEIWDLRHTLAFETLRVTLLFLLLVIRLGAAWVRYAKDWLETAGLQEGVKLGHKIRAKDRTTDRQLDPRKLDTLDT